MARPVRHAHERIDILVYAALFLHEQHPDLNAVLADKAAGGCRIRFILGDPESAAVKERGCEERFGHGIESRCRLALMHFRPLLGHDGVEIRQHGTTLYNSLYRADDQLLVNTHFFGMKAYGSPLLHLRRAEEGSSMFDAYAGSFEAVWETATKVES